MDEYESTRRRFLKKLGLTVGATITASSMLSATVLDKKENLQISSEQKEFMYEYEKWMDEFIVVINKQKADPDDYENNKKIVSLSEQAKTWQNKLLGYMQDQNFARHYMAATERMTLEIQ